MTVWLWFSAACTAACVNHRDSGFRLQVPPVQGPELGVVEVRAARLSRDLHAVVSLALACRRAQLAWAGGRWVPPHPVAERRLWAERLDDEASRVAVATSGASAVGVVCCWRRSAEPDGPGMVAGPYVDPEWWGNGIGSDLHDEALSALVRLGCRRAEGVVENGNRRARRFLERHGWRPLEKPGGGAEALVTYARSLPERRMPRFSRTRPKLPAA